MHAFFRTGLLAAAFIAAAPMAQAATGASCASTGSVTVSSTIRVVNTSYDGGCRVYNPTSALGDGSQSEGQSPVFRVENSTLRRVIIGNNGADGIHTYGNSTLDNVTWWNVGEDAMTVKSAGTVTVRNVTGWNAADKFFQMNAAGTLNVSNCKINTALKAFRQNGGSSYKTVAWFNNCDLTNIGEAVFRTDSSTSTGWWTTGRATSVRSVCRGYASGKCGITGVSGVTRVNY